jgi:pilus assembly protein CpaF
MSESLAKAIRELVAEDLSGPLGAELVGEDRREFARQQIIAHLDELTDSGGTVAGGSGGRPEWPQLVDTRQEQELAQTVLDALFGMGGLQGLIDDPDIENIDINGCDQVWVTYADGRKCSLPAVADSDQDLVDMVRSAASRFGLSERRFDLARPELDLRLPDGSRLSALMAVTRRPAVSVRRHRFADLSLADLVDLGTIDEELGSMLRAAVRARKNIVVSGAMNSGKTTLLRALAAEVAPRERIVTIEQAFELGLDTDTRRHPDLVALEARPANVEGEGAIGVADLVRRALRMNADRVIVGEVLGDEVLPMLNAMSQGRSGSMCTIHSDSSAGVFRRIASYAVQAPERLPLEATNLLIAGAVHFVVHLDTEMHDLTDPSDPGVAAADLSGASVSGPSGPSGADPYRSSGTDLSGSSGAEDHDSGTRAGVCFPARSARRRFVSSVREVVDAEGVQVVSNEIYRPGRDRRAEPSSPLRPATLHELVQAGYRTRSTAMMEALA